MEHKKIIEGLLFAAQEPLSLARIQSILEGVQKAVVRQALQELATEYVESERAFRLEEVAGGYQLRTLPELAPWLRRLRREPAPKLSQASMETLAVIAYRQPVTRAEVEYIRGVDCGGVLRGLLEKGLLKILGRKDVPGRPLLYGTTRRFLELFGLKDLSSLPHLVEVEELKRSEVAVEEPQHHNGQINSDTEQEPSP